MRKNLTHRFFELGVLIKGLDGVLEVIGGTLALFVSPFILNGAVRFLTQHELAEDPRDLLANYLIGFFSRLTPETQLFASLYLLGHGAVKIFLVVNLLRGKAWAYPWAIFFLLVFIVYQAYRLSYDPSAGLLLLTIFDLMVAGLVYLEYRRNLKRS